MLEPGRAIGVKTGGTGLLRDVTPLQSFLEEAPRLRTLCVTFEGPDVSADRADLLLQLARSIGASQ